MTTYNYLPHLVELRHRLLKSAFALLLTFSALFYFSNHLYNYFAKPILKQLQQGHHLVATEITAPFMVPMKLAFLCSLLICMPYLLYQVWAFIAPGLYRQERKMIAPWLIGSCFLFYSGMLLAYGLICPLALNFFAHVGPSSVTLMIDIGDYLNFVVNLLLGGGLAFQVPIATLACIQSGFISHKRFSEQRPYIIVAAFTLGMLLTPPDVISQILLALPMWGLFELCLYYAKKQEDRKLRKVAAQLL